MISYTHTHSCMVELNQTLVYRYDIKDVRVEYDNMIAKHDVTNGLPSYSKNLIRILWETVCCIPG